MHAETSRRLQRKRKLRVPHLPRHLAAVSLLILAVVAATCMEPCNCTVTYDDGLARLQVVDGGEISPNAAIAHSFGETGREDGYAVYRSFTRGGTPGAYSVKFGFASAVSVDVGCADYFRYPLPNLTDRDEFTLYVQMRVFDLGEDDERTRPVVTFVGPWSEEVAITCAREFFDS